MTFRNGFYAGLIVAVIWGVCLARLWHAQRQVELHNVHLLAQVEKKNWKAVAEFVGHDYQDRWGNNRALLLERLREVFRALPSAGIEFSGATTRTQDGRGYWSAKINIKGSGEFADFIEGRVNSLESQFEFEWQRGATWPWDWKLVAVRNPDLEIPDLR
jgi:spore germination protein YaaH